MSSGTLINLGIVPQTAKFADSEGRRKYQYARDVGTLECPTNRVMFLGDRGVGKTSTKRLLLGLDHDPNHNSTVGIHTHVTETNTVTENWKEITDDSIKEYENSDFKRAIAYFCAFREDVRGLGSRRQTISNALWAMVRFLVALTCASMICLGLFYIEDLVPHYPAIVLCCTIVVTFCTRDPVLGFNIGNGLSVCLLFGHFWIMEAGWLLAYEVPNITSRIIVLAMLSGAVGGLLGCLLGIGIGGGMSMTLCIMQYAPSTHADVLDGSLILPVPNEAVAFLIFIISLFLGLFWQSETVRRLSPRFSKAVPPIIMLVSSILSKSFIADIAVTHFYMSGVLFGTMFAMGQVAGRAIAWRLSLGHANRLLTDYLGAMVGVLFGHCLGWRLPNSFEWTVAFGLFGFTFCVSCELYRYHVIVRDPVPVGLIRKMRQEGSNHWPTKLYLLDCAGNNLFHNIHHIFMSRHACYMIIFRMDHYRDQPDECFERILYWINSVFAHARHQDAKAFLVATHKMEVPDNEERERLLRELSDKMKSFRGRLGRNTAKNTFVFSLDNSQREHNDSDVEVLKEKIWDSAMTAEYKTRPNRVSWFAFPDVIRDIRDSKESEGRRKHVIMTCHDLWDKVRDRCQLRTQTDFYRMLRYYNDVGEIYYDSRDTVLCKYVVLSPTLLMDVVTALLQRESAVVNIPERLMVDQETLKTTGIISGRLLSEYLKEFEMDRRQLVRLLQSLDVIFPLNPSTGLLTDLNDRYIVTSMLPLRSGGDPVALKKVDRILVFDFDYFYPEPVFMRLLAKCYQLSFSTTEQYSFYINNNNLRMYRDVGLFYFGNGIQYTISLFRPNATTNHIWFHIRQLSCETMKSDLYDFMQQMEDLVNRICFRYFEFLEYRCQIVCDCSTEQVAAPVYNSRDVPDVDLITIVDRRQGQGQERQFPERKTTYLCGRDNERTVEFNAKPIVEDERKEGRVGRTAHPEGRVDVFISCCAEDRCFVQTDLVPFLENADSESVGRQGRNVTVIVNHYDNPNPNGSYWSAHAINQQLLHYSRCMISVISNEYLSSPECKDVQHAVKLRVPNIPVLIRNCKTHPDLVDTAPIHYPESADNLLNDFYVPLIRAVRKQIRTEYDDTREPVSQIRRLVDRFMAQQKTRTSEEEDENLTII